MSRKKNGEIEIACPDCKGSGRMQDVTDQGLPRVSSCLRCGGGRVLKLLLHELTFVTSAYGDWEGVYVDGQLKCENHTIGTDDLLGCVGWKLTDLLSMLGIVYKEQTADGEWLSEQGNLPKELSKCKMEKPPKK